MTGVQTCALPIFDARVARSIAKHELAGAKYMEANAIRSVEEKTTDKIVEKIEKDSLDFLRKPKTGLFNVLGEDYKQLFKFTDQTTSKEIQDTFKQVFKEYGVPELAADKHAGQLAEFVHRIGPDMLNDVRILQGSAYSDLNDFLNGQYFKGLVMAYKNALDGTDTPNTFIHELWHHLQNYVTPEDQAKLEADLYDARSKMVNSDLFQKWWDSHIVPKLRADANTPFANNWIDEYTRPTVEDVFREPTDVIKDFTGDPVEYLRPQYILAMYTRYANPRLTDKEIDEKIGRAHV